MNKKQSLLIFAGAVLLILGYRAMAKDNLQNSSINSATPTKNIEALSEDVSLFVDTSDVDYFPDAKGYLAKPKAQGNYPGVILIHENRGLRPEIKSAANLLANEGYVVLAVDLYKGKVVESQEEARNLSSGFDQKTGVENMQAAAKYLRDQGVKKLAVWGWCFGGRQSVELSISGENLDATVVYYGGGMATTKERLSPIKWPVLGVFGDKDQAIPVETVKNFEQSLKDLKIDNEIYIYPGVGHAFANPSGMNYAPNETKDAWGKTISFLNKHLKSQD